MLQPSQSVPNSKTPGSGESQVPEADPARPTVTNPAHIPAVGYLQSEQGILFATATPSGVTHQTSIVQATRLSVHPRVMLEMLSQPFAATRISSYPDPAISTRDTGDLLLGVQGLLVLASGARPTVALAYNRRVRSGTAPDLDIGSYSQSSNLLVSGDVHNLHFDTNFGVSEQQAQTDGSAPPVRRAQYNQSLSMTHTLLHPDLEITGELWHFTQPLVTTTSSGDPSTRSNAVGVLLAFGYSLRHNLVLDAGLNHGLTPTSTEWEGFAGFTYLLPHRLWPQAGESSPPGSHRRRRTRH